MPPGAKSTKDKQSRRLARAKTKRVAKARERQAKTEKIDLQYEETIRAKKVEKAGIPKDEWERFLRVFEQNYKGKYAASKQTSTRSRAPTSATGASANVTRPKK